MINKRQVMYDLERCVCHVPDACRDCSHCYTGMIGFGCMENLISDALALLKGYDNALKLMVLQYCTDDDDYLWNRCMSAGEAAFKVLGVKNGDSADELWTRLEGEVE